MRELFEGLEDKFGGEFLFTTGIYALFINNVAVWNANETYLVLDYIPRIGNYKMQYTFRICELDALTHKLAMLISLDMLEHDLD
jgi:hypothetical protein